ncbi:MAG: aminotransferase class V-fold PLP-dependent enzyme [Alphaproteobacteria bacterium]|nr:aminotransferase class V-fold PLP-dependent enzyme [Alphaproteobacteria bacterium]
MSLDHFMYFDYQASTPVDPRVLEVMLPWFTENYVNPHASYNFFKNKAFDAIEEARNQVANLIAADSKEIIFTSGATESNNLAIVGAVNFLKSSGKNKTHIITCATEHKCVLEAFAFLKSTGIDITILPVLPDGLLDLNLLSNSITEKTGLVSIMSANNEIGSIQPIKEIGELCQKHGIIFHTDAVQAVGKMTMDVNDMYIDLLSISGHKIYASKGIGALYVRRKPRIRLQPLFHGGGQERGMRSGTLATSLCIGLGKACFLAKTELEANKLHLNNLTQRLLKKLMDNISDIQLNGSLQKRIPGNLNFSIKNRNGALFLEKLSKELIFSTGSACASADVEPSHVLKAIGCPNQLARASFRLSIGQFTTLEEIDKASEKIISLFSELKN